MCYNEIYNVSSRALGFQAEIFSNITRRLVRIRTWLNIRRIKNAFENFVLETPIRTYYATML